MLTCEIWWPQPCPSPLVTGFDWGPDLPNKGCAILFTLCQKSARNAVHDMYWFIDLQVSTVQVLANPRLGQVLEIQDLDESRIWDSCFNQQHTRWQQVTLIIFSRFLQKIRLTQTQKTQGSYYQECFELSNVQCWNPLHKPHSTLHSIWTFFCSLQVWAPALCSTAERTLGTVIVSFNLTWFYATAACRYLMAAGCTGWRQRKNHFKWSIAFNLHETMQHSVHKFSGHWICGCVYQNLQWQTMSSHESCFYRHDMCACLGQVDKHMHTVIMLGWHVWGQMAGVDKPQTHRRYNCDIAKCRVRTWNEVLQTDWCVLFWMLPNHDDWEKLTAPLWLLIIVIAMSAMPGFRHFQVHGRPRKKSFYQRHRSSILPAQRKSICCSVVTPHSHPTHNDTADATHKLILTNTHTHTKLLGHWNCGIWQRVLFIFHRTSKHWHKETINLFWQKQGVQEGQPTT